MYNERTGIIEVYDPPKKWRWRRKIHRHLVESIGGKRKDRVKGDLVSTDAIWRDITHSKIRRGK